MSLEDFQRYCSENKQQIIIAQDIFQEHRRILRAMHQNPNNFFSKVGRIVNAYPLVPLKIGQPNPHIDLVLVNNDGDSYLCELSTSRGVGSNMSDRLAHSQEWAKINFDLMTSAIHISRSNGKYIQRVYPPNFMDLLPVKARFPE